MKVALAQIDMRIGDIEGVLDRLESQARLAHGAGAGLLCCPAPLLCGMSPTGLIEYPGYERALVGGLAALARRLEDLSLACVVPAVVSYEGAPLVEAFVLRRGRAVPARTLLASQRPASPDAWVPPVFEVSGVRVAVTFDAARDVERLPHGCDLVLYFQIDGFCPSDPATAAAASVASGEFGGLARRAGAWLACMAPVGGFDDMVYTGGSFVLDDSGALVAASPSFEEDLLVQEVRRGVSVEPVASHELPAYRREEWTWQALILHLRDCLDARGETRAVVPLEGDLASSLLAVLAVDALGPRNVIGVSLGSERATLPREHMEEIARLGCARAVASNLGIRLVERTAAPETLDRDESGAGAGRMDRALGMLCLVDVARELDAAVLSAHTKTDAALDAASLALDGAPWCAVAPFGDLYLSSLEFLARHRSRTSGVLPARLMALDEVERGVRRILDRAVSSFPCDGTGARAMREVLAGADASFVDGVLEAHIDRNLPFEELPGAEGDDRARALLLALVRAGEASRRVLPPCPVLSPRSLAERAWPIGLAWSDTGGSGEGPSTIAELARAETERAEHAAGERGRRMRAEFMGLLGNLLGLTPEQREQLMSEEGQARIEANMEELGAQLERAVSQGELQMPSGPVFPGQVSPDARPGDYPFFSQN